MVEIFFKVYGSVRKVDAPTPAEGRVIWDALARANFHMMSVRP